MEFAYEMSSGIFKTLTPYVTSDFDKHSLTATTSVVSNLVSAVVSLPYAKLVEIWGRTQGFALMVASLILGVAMMAGCNNVETYCAAQVFYSVGYYGIKFSVVLFVADVTALRNRAFLIGLVGAPNIAVIWAYGPAAESILETIGWRWGFGMWCIIFVVVFAPLLLIFRTTQRNLLPSKQREKVHRTWIQSFVHWCMEFDLIGIVILAAGLGMLLLALDIHGYQPDGWASPTIICLIVFGALLIPGFALYEKYLATSTFIPWQYLTNRTVVTTNIMILCLQVGMMMSSAYFYSFLIVVFRLSVTNATYITNIYYLGNTIMNLFIGVTLRYLGRIKYYALCIAIPCALIGCGLMIKFRTPDSEIGLVILSQILIAFAGGIMFPIEQMTLMAVAPHEHVSALLAVESVFALTGKAIGYAISGAIWTGMFESKLAAYLPESELPNLADIYGSINVQSAYPADSEGFAAIAHAYGDTQRIILIVSTCFFAACGVLIAFWQDIDVKKMKHLRDRA
ncbi:hypothetical protein MBLNU230_g5259t1 [Neophaeotheca triangularis]